MSFLWFKWCFHGQGQVGALSRGEVGAIRALYPFLSRRTLARRYITPVFPPFWHRHVCRCVFSCKEYKETLLVARSRAPETLLGGVHDAQEVSPKLNLALRFALWTAAVALWGSHLSLRIHRMSSNTSQLSLTSSYTSHIRHLIRTIYVILYEPSVIEGQNIGI